MRPARAGWSEADRGHWRGKLPGLVPLAVELDVSTKTIEAALRQLEGEKLLRGRGQGRSRVIIHPRAAWHPEGI